MAPVEQFTVYIVFAAIIALVLLVVSLVNKFNNGSEKGNAARRGPRVPVPLDADAQPAMQRRMARRRMRVNRNDSDDDGFDPDNIDDDAAFDDIVQSESKVGAKKLKKIQEKAEKKAMREQMEQEREEKKQRDAELEKVRKKQVAEDAEEEAIKEEEEKKRLEEKKRQEHEEYLLLKQQFAVEEEGENDAERDLNSHSLLQEFIQYIKDMKVVMLDELAAHFQLNTQDVVNRVQSLQETGELTGVIDDRGKFIYINLEELQEVAKYIRQQGRISISDLADASNRLINLNPEPRESHTNTVTAI